MDFYRIKENSIKNGTIEVYPDFKVGRSKDLMVRGKSFYAIFDKTTGLWSTDEYDVQRLVDKSLSDYYEKKKAVNDGTTFVRYMGSFGSGSWSIFRKYLQNISDNAVQLDEELTFANTDVKKTDYASKRLPYPLEEGTFDAWDEIIGTLYLPEERAKLEWAIGSIIAGDAKNIQKFLVLYGEMGSGKSTILNIIQKLFDGYYTAFEAKALASSNNAFATEVFKANPLVAIQHDGDLSKIEDNTKLNSIISHEYMTMNEKYKPSYMSKINCMLFMGSNKPVKITDAKSGIIRRLIDVIPSGNKIPTKRYHALMAQTDFELGAIASHCLGKYRSMGKNYYADYKPLSMILQTDVFFNFVESYYFEFKDSNGISLTRAYDMYKTYCEDSLVEYKLARHRFRDELKNYFEIFEDVTRIEGKQIRSYYSNFLHEKFTNAELKNEEKDTPISLVLEHTESIFDTICENSPAQYATSNETPTNKWVDVKTVLSDIDTNKLHYVKVPENHIVIDFDMTDSSGEKDLVKNMIEASKWPPTYTELSKSGKGVHLHYYYTDDVTMLSRIYAEDIEVKVFSGKSSLRRKLSICNDIPIASINSGLPLKGDSAMIDFDAVKSERKLRDLIQRNLLKEIHGGTKPSVDFIHKILDDAYKTDLKYDVTDMRPHILAFANNSSNQASYCLKLVTDMKFKSEEPTVTKNTGAPEIEDLVFYDIEVYPNLLLISWKKGLAGTMVNMLNPTSEEVEELLKLPLVGFNNRRYDNHILYARYIGYTIEQIYNLSQKIIANSKNALFAEAYNLSYVDIYEFSATKQSLKKWEIELGIPHIEMDIPWNEPVPEELIPKVVEYCGNDVDATAKVFAHLEEDYIARQILADLSGLSINDTTQRHAAKIIFGNDRNAKSQFEYTDLSEMFPGYTYSFGKSDYRGEDPKEGGYVYAEPGMYENVAVFDIESMHPTSAIRLNVFGKYTKYFDEMIKARLAIKHKDYNKAKTMLKGTLTKYLTGDDSQAKKLSYALKIIINIIYGMTSAKFDNQFKDPKNIDNIVAKRGALFMIDLKHEVQKRGFQVVHIKTDSIKVPNITPELKEFIFDFASKYGYSFVHEDTYPKFCLVNNSVFIAQAHKDNQDLYWYAVGSQFAQPYVYKTLFSKEKIQFEDLCETNSVTTAMYLNMSETLEDDPKNYQHIGKVGRFTPILPGRGGGELLRQREDQFTAVTGSKGYRWLQASTVEEFNKYDDIDMSYYVRLADKAVDTISKFGDFEQFTENIKGDN